MKTVKEVLSGIGEQSRMASSKDVQAVVLALMTDKSHVTKIGKLSQNEVVVKEERCLADDFKEIVKDIMMKTGLKEDEVADLVENYKPKKEVADLIINLHQELIEQYALGKGKNMNILCKEGTHLNLEVGEVKTKTVYSVANPEKGIVRKPTYKVKKRDVRVRNRTLESMKINL